MGIGNQQTSLRGGGPPCIVTNACTVFGYVKPRQALSSLHFSHKLVQLVGQDGSSTMIPYTTSWVMFFKGENHVTFGAE